MRRRSKQILDFVEASVEELLGLVSVLLLVGSSVEERVVHVVRCYRRHVSWSVVRDSCGYGLTSGRVRGRSVWLQGAIGIAALLLPLLLEGAFEHADLSFELLVDPLCMARLALVLCDLGLHLGALNVPCVPGSLVVVPFDLEEAHNAWVASVSQQLGPRGRSNIPCNVYSAP